MKDLPAELMLDTYHPDNQEFMQSVNHLKQLMVAHEKRCRYRHVLIAKESYAGKKSTDIAEKMGIHVGTVHSILRREEIKQLLSLMQHYGALWEGPTIQHRKRHLWEIAVDTKTTDERVSIQAIKEMNAMDGVGKEKINPQIEITINSTMFPSTALDVS